MQSVRHFVEVFYIRQFGIPVLSQARVSDSRPYGNCPYERMSVLRTRQTGRPTDG